MTEGEMLMQLVGEMRAEIAALRVEVQHLRKEAARSRKASEEVLAHYRFDDDEEHEEYEERKFVQRANSEALDLQRIGLELMRRGMRCPRVAHAIAVCFPDQKAYKNEDSLRRALNRVFIRKHNIQDTTKVIWIDVDDKVILAEVRKLMGR